MPDERAYLDLAAGIVSAFVGHNSVHPAELPEIISSVHGSLAKLGTPPPIEEPALAQAKPAVPVRKSITPEYLISLEDGRRFKSLKRHLTSRGLTPAEYRAKWGLPDDYPMVAADYSTKRSGLAFAAGLGRKKGDDLVTRTALTPGSSEPGTVVPEDGQETMPPKRRGRPRKAS